MFVASEAEAPAEEVTNAEPAETFLVELWAPTRATIARAPATGTIQNDDPYDLLAIDTTTGHLERWRYSGAERIQRDTLVPDGTNELSTVVAVGDLNADGQIDIVRQNPDTTLVVWFMAGATRVGTATLNPATPPNSNWFIGAIYDVDGDGQPDILWQNSSEGSLRVWYMTGTTMTSTELLTVNRSNDTTWRIVGTGDVNGDGHRDLVWWHPLDGWLQVWTMNGITRLSSVMLNPDRVADVNWKPMAVVDANADGKPDLVWEHLNDGWLQVWYLNSVNLTDSVWMVPPQILPSWRIVGSFTR